MKTYPILGRYELTTLLSKEVSDADGRTYVGDNFEDGLFLWMKNKEELYTIVNIDKEDDGLKIIVERISKLECVELYEGYKDLWMPKKKIIMHYRPLEETQQKNLIKLIKLKDTKPVKNLAGRIFKRKQI